MREHGVRIQSWGGFAEGRNDLFTNPLLTDEQMARIATLDTGSSLFFDHHDPEIVTWLAKRRLDA